MMDRPQFCAGGRCGGLQFLATRVSTGIPEFPQELMRNEKERERVGVRGKERGNRRRKEREKRKRGKERENKTEASVSFIT